MFTLSLRPEENDKHFERSIQWDFQHFGWTLLGTFRIVAFCMRLFSGILSVSVLWYFVWVPWGTYTEIKGSSIITQTHSHICISCQDFSMLQRDKESTLKTRLPYISYIPSLYDAVCFE